MSKIFTEILYIVFLDNFYFSNFIFLLVFLTSTLRKFFNFELPNFLRNLFSYFLIFSAIAILVVLFFEFFSLEKGIDRLALVPLILGATPLFLYAVVASFIVLKKYNSPHGGSFSS